MHTNKQMRGVLDLLKVPEGTDGTQMHTVKLYMCIVPYKWIPPSTFWVVHVHPIFNTVQ